MAVEVTRVNGERRELWSANLRGDWTCRGESDWRLREEEVLASGPLYILEGRCIVVRLLALSVRA